MSIGTHHTSSSEAAPNEQRLRIQRLLKTFNFTDLFIEELGWDQPTNPAFFISIETEIYRIAPHSFRAATEHLFKILDEKRICSWSQNRQFRII